MQTQASTFATDYILPANAFRGDARPVRPATSAATSPNHVSRRQPAQLWASLEAEQASADFSHRVVYGLLAVGSLVPPIWTLVAQHAATL